MYEAIYRNMIFYSRANRTHMKGIVFSAVLKVKGFGTRIWPITSTAEFILETNYPSETDNSSKCKFGANTNYAPRLIRLRRMIRL